MLCPKNFIVIINKDKNKNEVKIPKTIDIILFLTLIALSLPIFTKDKSFSESTGNTHGIKLSINPPKKARIKN